MQERSIFGADGENSQYKFDYNPASPIERDYSTAAVKARAARARRIGIMKRRHHRRCVPVRGTRRLKSAKDKRISSRGAVNKDQQGKRDGKMAIEHEVELFQWEHKQFQERLFSHIDKIEEETRAAGVDINAKLEEVRRLALTSTVRSLPEMEE